MLIFIFKKQDLIKNKQKQIFITLAIIQGMTILTFYINGLITKGYHHLLSTDFCPFLAILSIPVFISRNEKLLKMIMPWMFLGAVLTMVTSDPGITGEGLVFGLSSMLKHACLLIQSVFLMVVLKKYTRKDLMFVFGLPFLFGLWIVLAAFIPWKLTGNIKWAVFTTALLKPSVVTQTISYSGHTETVGDYAVFSEIGPYPWISILFYVVSFLIVTLIVLAKNYGQIIANKFQTRFFKNKSKIKYKN